MNLMSGIGYALGLVLSPLISMGYRRLAIYAENIAILTINCYIAVY